jgi:hypothetical protein
MRYSLYLVAGCNGFGQSQIGKGWRLFPQLIHSIWREKKKFDSLYFVGVRNVVTIAAGQCEPKSVRIFRVIDNPPRPYQATSVRIREEEFIYERTII